MIGVARPTDAAVPVKDLADFTELTQTEIVKRLKELGWQNCRNSSKVPPIMTEVLIDFIAGDLDAPTDDEFGPIDDPGLPAPLDHPFYALGDGTQRDFILV